MSSTRTCKIKTTGSYNRDRMQNKWFLRQQSNSGTKSKPGFSPPYSVFLPWNWKHLINRQVQWKKVFWQMILHSYLCNTLLRVSSKSKAINVFPKYSEIESTWPIKSSKEQIVLSCDSKNYLSNVWWKFLIKLESM